MQVQNRSQLFPAISSACFAFSANYTHLPRFNAIFLFQKGRNLCRESGGKQWLFQ
jgi:hypothetical protein